MCDDLLVPHLSNTQVVWLILVLIIGAYSILVYSFLPHKSKSRAKKNKMSKLILTTLICLLPHIAYALDLNVSWLPNAESEVVKSYSLYQREELGEFTNSIDMGLPSLSLDKKLHFILNIDDLAKDKKYFYVLTAINATGEESAYSEEKSIFLASRPSPPSEFKIDQGVGDINIIIRIGTTQE